MLATACFTPFLLFLPELCNISKSDLSTHRTPTKLGHSEKTNPENPSGLHEHLPHQEAAASSLPAFQGSIGPSPSSPSSPTSPPPTLTLAATAGEIPPRRAPTLVSPPSSRALQPPSAAASWNPRSPIPRALFHRLAPDRNAPRSPVRSRDPGSPSRGRDGDPHHHVLLGLRGPEPGRVLRPSLHLRRGCRRWSDARGRVPIHPGRALPPLLPLRLLPPHRPPL
jgi:hypothetical protein